MEPKTRSILVFGASSPTGQHIVQEALKNGWAVKTYGRRTLPEHAENPNIDTMQGTLEDTSKLRQVIKGTTVIISVVGPAGTKIKNTPFPAFYRRIFDIMREENVKRIFALSTFSVSHPNDRYSLACSLLVSMLWVVGNSAWRNLIEVGETFDQHAKGLEWTLFRVGFLKNQGPCNIVSGYVGDGKLGLGVNRIDVARWVVSQAGAEKAKYVGDKPGISSS